ncbi:uncharacterized protein LOC106663146 [Cimex lectularius]|uniref:DUF4780 domain-containing protein n=1 Tax=Cimex lectularius TaxID=79782 RepID=A0A8I6RDF4_CIMLE|nr:uncharacterized protein LOC106663146 [Cimex lectularius]
MDKFIYQNLQTLIASQPQFSQGQNVRSLFSEADLNYQNNALTSRESAFDGAGGYLGNAFPNFNRGQSTENLQPRYKNVDRFSDSSFRQNTIGIGRSYALGTNNPQGNEYVNLGGQNATCDEVIRKRFIDQGVSGSKSYRGQESALPQSQAKMALLPTPTIGVVNAHYQGNHAVNQPGFSQQIDQLSRHTGEEGGSMTDHDMRRYQDVDLRLISESSFSGEHLENSRDYPHNFRSQSDHIDEFNAQKRRRMCEENFVANTRSPLDYGRQEAKSRKQDRFERNLSPERFEREVYSDQDRDREPAWDRTIIPDKFYIDDRKRDRFDDESPVRFDARRDRSRSPQRFDRERTVGQDGFYGIGTRSDEYATSRKQDDFKRRVLIRTSPDSYDMDQDRFDRGLKRPRSPERYGDRSRERFTRGSRSGRSPVRFDREEMNRNPDRFDRGNRLGRSPVRFEREEMNRNQDRFDRGNRFGRSPVRFEREEMNRNQDRFDRGNRFGRSPVRFEREEINRNQDRFERGNRASRSPVRFERKEINRNQDRFDRGNRTSRSPVRFDREEMNRNQKRFDRRNRVDRQEMHMSGRFGRDKMNRKSRFEEDTGGAREYRDAIRSPNKPRIERVGSQERFGKQEKERFYQKRVAEREERRNQDRPQGWNRSPERYTTQGKMQNVSPERTARVIRDRKNKCDIMGRPGSQNMRGIDDSADGKMQNPGPLVPMIERGEGANGRSEIFAKTSMLTYGEPPWLNAPTMLANENDVNNLLNATRDSIVTLIGSSTGMGIVGGSVFADTTANKVQPFGRKEQQQFLTNKIPKSKGLVKKKKGPPCIPPETIFYGDIVPDSYILDKDNRDNDNEVEIAIHNINSEFQIIGKKKAAKFTKLVAHSLNNLDITKLDNVPVFYDVTWDTGKLMMFAKNSKSVDWLQKCLSNDKTLGTSLKLIPKYGMHKAKLFIPGDSHQVYPNELLARFSRQNPQLNCAMWHVWSVKPSKNGMSCVFDIDNESKAILKSKDYYAYYGVEKIFFDFKPTKTTKLSN